jgi:phenylacetate-CoA ligase
MNYEPYLIRKVIAPLWARHEGSPYLKILRRLAADQFISFDERQRRQWRQLKSVIRHAWDNSLFYRKRFTAIGFQPGDLKTWRDFELLPFLSKTEIRSHAAEMISRNAKSDLVPRKTSGSTGVSLNFYTSDSEFQLKRAITIFRDQWTGWKLGDWKAMVWGNPAYLDSRRGRLRNILLERMFSLDTLKMNESMMEAFAAEIFRRKPTMLFGHAHSLYLFARFWEKRGLPRYSFNGVLSTAMVLHEHEREKCRSLFGPVFDRYGCEEVSLIASECEAHEGLHVNTDSLYVELLKNGNSAPPDVEGAVVVTDLCNLSMPFIRYQVGDMAVASDKKCGCSRSYPLFSKVTGRIADYLITPEGDLVSGISLTENFATLIPGIEQIQIIQEQRSELTLNIVPSSDFSDESRIEIARLVVERFGNEMKHKIELKERIPPEKSGKYRFSICKVVDEKAFNF